MTSVFKHFMTASCAFVFLFHASNADAQVSPRDTRMTAVPENLLSGGKTDGFRAWSRAVAGSARQGTRDGIAGYDSNSAGVSFGVDKALSSCPAVVGASVGYINTDIDGNTTSHSDVDSFQFSAYGDYNLGGGVFVRGSLGYTRDENESQRFNAGAPGVTAFGDYSADQFDALAQLMRYMQFGAATLAPNAMLRAIHYSPDSYNETGAGLANLHTDQAGMNVVEIGAGVDAAWIFDANDGSGRGFSPGLHLGASYDLAGDRIETSTSAVGGGPVTTTFGPSVARARLNAGASVVWFSGGGFDFKAAYDIDLKQDYFGQAGTLRVTGQF